MKNGIILLGGQGTRLQPFTHAINKSLLNVNGKCVVDYPLETLKNLGVENVSVILGGDHFNQIINYLQDGQRYNMNFNYIYQGEPKGISQAINLCRRYVADEEEFVVILGDNLFENKISFSIDNLKCAQIVLNEHSEIHRFGCASINNNGDIVSIIEKPKIVDNTLNNYAITGCYLFNQKFFKYFSQTKPSQRGEWEITDIIQAYQNDGKLLYTIPGGEWLDAGTHDSLIYANNFFYQKEHGIYKK